MQNAYGYIESEIADAERKYNIPESLLRAIALEESAVNSRPYPWAICVNGKSHYYPTKAEAIAATRRFIAVGKRNIDVGCMQVNLMHHRHAFRNLEEAFDPRRNIEYAAKFLLALKNEYGTWARAVCFYHSRTAKHYKPYLASVHAEWKKLRKQWMAQRLHASRIHDRRACPEVVCETHSAQRNTDPAKRLFQLGLKSLKRGIPKFMESTAR
jgi:hypothetical protein